MSDYSGIGDAMTFLLALAAFAVPVAVGCLVGLTLSAFGFTDVGIGFGVAGLLSGILLAVKVNR